MAFLPPDFQAPMCNELDIEVKLSQFEDKLDWSTLFGNSNPVGIELGCGKGMFIIRSVQENPDVNYFGIEKSSRFFRILKKRATKSGVRNIRLLKAEAGYFIWKFVPEKSVQAFHIYFPDPWPKKRHHKRRLVNTEFIERIKSSLTAKGCIFFATDFVDYFNHIVDTARACKGIEEIFCNVIHLSEANPDEAATNYERKYIMQGRSIYKAAYRKS